MANDLVWTNHVEERLLQRGITRNEAWDTIRHPDKYDRLDGQKWKFYKKFGTKQVVLVTALKDGQYVILTSWVKGKEDKVSGLSNSDQFVWSILSSFGRVLVQGLRLVRNVLSGK